jgi:hypothetical protein
MIYLCFFSCQYHLLIGSIIVVIMNKNNGIMKNLSILSKSMSHNSMLINATIINLVENQFNTLFCINGLVGTWKTILYNIVVANVQSQRKIVIYIASLKIAALFLDGNRTFTWWKPHYSFYFQESFWGEWTLYMLYKQKLHKCYHA